MPAPPEAEVALPEVADLRPGESRAFRVELEGGVVVEGFVLRLGDELFAYENRCPHWYVDLDLGLGGFYVPELDRIVCKNHGAHFDPRTGACTRGPCRGARIRGYSLRVVDGVPWVTVYPPE